MDKKADAKAKTDSEKRKQDKARRKIHCAQLVLPLLSSPESCRSCLLYLALAALSRPTCSALNLCLTLSKAQGPSPLGGITKRSRSGQGRPSMKGLKVQGEGRKRKKEGFKHKGGSWFATSFLI